MLTVRTVSRYLCFALLFLLLFAGPSCSVKKNYKTLSLFFDGVPKPGTKDEKKTERQEPGPAAPGKPGLIKPVNQVPIVSSHPGYTQRKCRDCHNTQSISFLKEKKDQFCYTCHKEENYTGDYLHGPVAVGACLACHLPHESRHERLLKSDVPQLCIDCHTTWDKRDVKAHGKGNMCTQCHNPHAGSSRFFLEEGIGKREDDGRIVI